MKAISKTLALAVILGLFSIPAAVATTSVPALIEDQPHMQQALEAAAAGAPPPGRGDSRQRRPPQRRHQGL